MKWNSLRGRVVTWYVLSLAVVLLFCGVTMYFGIQGFLRHSLENSLEGRAKSIGARFLEEGERQGPKWMTGEINEAYAPDLSGRFIRITRSDGRVFYFSGGSRDSAVDDTEVTHPDATTAREGFRTEGEPGRNQLLLFTQPFVTSSKTLYLIETGASLKQIHTVLASVLKILFLLSPLVLLAAGVGANLLLKHPLRPLLVLSERAEHIGQETLGERLPVPQSGDEIEKLALSLNRMITRLEDALSQNRRFSDEVSHELRTPLTIMRGELEHVLFTTACGPAVAEPIGSALEEIGRMSEIVDNLLDIGVLSAGATSLQLQPVDVSRLCRWVVDQMQPLAQDKHIEIVIQTNPLTVDVDESRIKQVLLNLIDNAIKYTPRHGRIVITSFVEEAFAVIDVADTGIGIEPHVLPHVFDRFFRADEARSRVTGGVGLGLSIVKAICEAHQGSITVRSESAVGTVFRIALPLTAASAAPLSV